MRFTRLTTLPTFGILLWAAAASALVEDRIDETYVVDSDAAIAVENVNGSITIEAWDRDEVRVEAVKKASSDSRLERVKVEIEASPDRIRIETKLGSSGKFWDRNSGNASVSYRISVPSTVELDSVSSVNGGVRIEGVQGPVRASTVNGDLDATGLMGDAKLETVNGSVEASFEQMGSGQRVTVESVNGGVRVYIPEDSDVSVDAETVNGSLKNDFGLDVKKGKWVGADMKGSIGSGAARLSAETVNGSVRVLRRR